MNAGTVLSVNLAVPEPSTAKRVGITGIAKQPVEHAVLVRPPGPKTTGLHSGLVGDQIFDVAHHGGDDQAVYAYAREDYDWWEQQLGVELPGGRFGENLTLAGVDVNGAVVGETWQIGAELVLQATLPRIPCSTFQAKMAVPHWVKRFTAAGRPGAYLRVVQAGEVRAGDPVRVLDRPAHGITIAETLPGWLGRTDDVLHRLLAADDLPGGVRAEAEEQVAR
ncbi:MOSC domain-containing protein [Jidongwangia harbinensis]|uniref:MOSC domain-containing protein n=1 Tax=Jidongwangia harbinensis TaxID=2878561 RepID=UPI0027E05A4D|nr:MOSC domain-containing protein [Jidongwangia harbinensis]